MPGLPSAARAWNVVAKVTERRGKVIVYKCDGCNMELGRFPKKRLTERDGHETQRFWDVCQSCLDKAVGPLGKGTKIEIEPYRRGL